MDQPRILVAHPLTSTGEAIAALLVELRPAYRIERVPATELDAALGQAQPAPVVLCGEPTPAVQARGRGWIALLPGGQDVALIGVGDAWRVHKSPCFAAVVAAVDELVAGSAAPAALGAAPH